ncbi:PAS domain S-box protein [Mucilaginibacter terrae]|uniref:Sigma-B regulation protein RsbU (Phosphoserine phosphatase) n=1 Tax=Mucilaginibacter terrae TaxID=1955052 RepID=A0ABU3H0X0_9SPHI|nr:PAS domain S-box protein [Mucilaginibacter terrae]MDT3404570.1 sigma-B regulation protein RsbU (phosphoserine phosphatase) [Mucilaginibacter terrae]
MKYLYPLISSSDIDFESIYNNAPVGLFTFHADGSIVHVNQTLLKWLNADAHEVMYQNVSSFLDRGGKIYYQLFVQPLLQLENDVKEISFQILTDKCSFPCLFSAKAFRKNEDGELLFAATVYQVSHRKMYEEELLRKKAEADAEKAAKAAALQEVAFDQSHLVRAPLANILGLTALLEEMDISDDIKSMVTMLRASANKLDSEVIKISNKLST